MKKLISMKIAALFICLGALSMLAFLAIGSRTDADGTLHEPFAFVPLAWLSLALGAIIGVLCLIRKNKPGKSS